MIGNITFGGDTLRYIGFWLAALLPLASSVEEASTPRASATVTARVVVLSRFVNMRRGSLMSLNKVR